jgi:Uma2 family endonuclease
MDAQADRRYHTCMSAIRNGLLKSTIIVEDDVVQIPSWVTDLASFRKWADAEDFPETGRICYLKGEIWVDMSKQQVFTHVDVKSAFTSKLYALAEKTKLGRYFGDGLRFVNARADVSSVPDGTFVLFKTLRNKRARFVPGKEEGFVELEGSPDVVLEILSAGSVEKDTVILYNAYLEAGIAEYWVVDARSSPLQFDIHRHTGSGFELAAKESGWLKSTVFGKEFKLTRRMDSLGLPHFDLKIR